MRLRWVIAAVLLAGACIIPDRGIQFEGGPANPGAVRILQRAAVPDLWSQWCLDRTLKREVEGTDIFCPAVAQTRSGGLLSPSSGDFCICPDGQRDARAPELWTIYAEDPDLDGDEAKDSLYGVFLIDPDPLSAAPSSHMAYENYFEPCSRGTRTEEAFSELIEPDDPEYAERVLPPIARNTAPQWAFRVDDAFSDTMDLCNDDNGTAQTAGLHNLQFLVTDRPFFRASRPDGDLERRQCGVPDIAAGATYDVINYVFECIDGTLEENAEACRCEEVEGL